MNLPPALRIPLRRLAAALLFFGSLGPMLVEGGGIPVGEVAMPWVRGANVLFAALLAFSEFTRFRAARYRMAHVREEIVDVALLGATLLMMGTELFSGGGLLGLRGLDALVVPSKGYIVANLVLRVVRLFRHIVALKWSYPKVFVGSFVVVILAGTVLLWALPGSRRPTAAPITFLDAMFTSVSATCVTGLTVRSTGQEFSRFGQTVILVLIQVGGLGLMTFAAFFAMAVRRGIGFTDRLILRDMLNVDPLNTLGSLLAGVVTVTFLTEGLGALLMFGNFPDPLDPSKMLPPGDQLYYATFHSVSAFCNAGFALYDANWTPFLTSPLMSGVVMAEIILGGLGFTVILNMLGLSEGLRHRIRGLLRRRPLTHEEEEVEERREPTRVSLQTKVVLGMTAVLVFGGAVLIWVFERGGTMTDLDGPTTLLACLFQSVTTRTAGFNTVDISALQSGTLFLMVLLMFIGASPGGTGGGIKTVTAAVLLRSVTALARGRNRVEMSRRSLPPEVIAQAVVVVTLSCLAVFLATLVLSLTEGETLRGAGAGGRAPFLSVLFEAVSAFGTVGLSCGSGGGLTPHVSPVGRCVLMLLMLMGRIGPITLTLAMGRRSGQGYEFPEERLMIG